MNKKAKLDTNCSLKSVLLSFVKIFKADAVILYKFIQKEDLEATELLSLLGNSPITSHDNFYTEIKEDFLKDYPGGLKKLIDDFRNGTLPNDDETKDAFYELKNNIRVLRFSSHAEQNPEKSRWDFDYNQRPPKYLVFSDEILKNPEKDIKNEGMTAYFCRANKETIDKKFKNNNESKGILKNLILERKILRKQPSHSTIHSDPNVYDNFSSHHAAWMILNDPENNTKSIGCLRFEFYDQNSIGEIIKKAREKLVQFAVEPVNEFIVTDIMNVLEKNKEFSYLKMYKCLEPILSHIKEIGNKTRRDRANLKKKNEFENKLELIMKEENKDDSKKKEAENICEELSNINDAQELFDIHYQIEHLLYVLKRNTYFGDDIITRIKFFIKVLLEKLSLPGDIFTDVWDRLKRHEDLMLYDIDKYRDHLMHQFHTFLCGYIIIHKLELSYFQKLINNNYSQFISEEKREYFPKFTRLDVLRIWTLASLFHDCGYAFEKLSEGLETFSERVSGIKLKSKYFWDDFIFNEDIVPKIFQSLSSYYIINKTYGEKECKIKAYHSKLTESFIFRILTQRALKNNDHGVLSSIILMQQYYKHQGGFSKIPRIAHIINIACLAIALHNKSVFNEIRSKDNTGICLSLNPIIFLLVYCDTATEWGRIKVRDYDETNYRGANNEERKNYISPHLRKISIETDDIDQDCKDCKKTSILLDYPASENGIYLDPESIDRFLSPVLASFISPKDKSFEIKYNVRGSETDFRSKRFMNCAYC